MPHLKLNRALERILRTPKPIKVIIGGRGCIHPDTPIDTPRGQIAVKDFKGGPVYAFDGYKPVVVLAEPPVRFHAEKMYSVQLQDGSSITCTDQHRFYCADGWHSLSSAPLKRLLKFDVSHHQTNSGTSPLESHEDVQRCLGTLLNFLSYCSECLRQYDQQPLLLSDTYLDALQRLADAQPHNFHTLTHLDGLGCENTHNPSQFLPHLSNLVALLEEEVQSCKEPESRSSEIVSGLLSGCSQALSQFREKKDHSQLACKLASLFLDFGTSPIYEGQTLQTIFDMLSCALHDSSFSNSLVSCNHSLQYTAVEKIEQVEDSEYYDLFVPFYNNYLSNGIVNHNSGKSIGVGDIMTMKMETECADIYCLREFQKDLDDSVHKVFKGSIQKRLKLDGWDIQERTVIAPTGAKTKYVGANRNPNSMQSAQDYKYSWFEEAHTASKDSLDKLLPTIIRNPGAECWFTANPQSSADAFSQRFIVPYQAQLDRQGFYEDDMHLIIIVNWRDNPWWNEEQEALRKWDFENRPRAEYDWIWEGKFNDTVENALIKPEWFDACVDAHLIPRLQADFKPYGAKIAALDPFDGGNDAGGFSIRHASIIEQVRIKDSGEIDEVCDWGLDLAIQNNCDWFVWDGDGMGTGLKGQIKQRLNGTRMGYHMFKGSLMGRAQDRAEQIYRPLGESDEYGENESMESRANPKTYAATFRNNRAQYYKVKAERMFNTWRCVVRGDYVDPDHMLSIASAGVDSMQQLRAETCRIPLKANGTGLIQIMSKQEMAKMNPPISSPNLADADMMTMVSPAEMIKGEEEFYGTGGAGSWMG